MAIDCRERDRALVRSVQALPYYRVHLTGNASRCPARPLAIRDGRRRGGARALKRDLHDFQELEETEERQLAAMARVVSLEDCFSIGLWVIGDCSQTQ